MVSLILEDSRGQGVKDSSEMQRSIGIPKKKVCRNSKNLKISYTIFRKQTLEPLNPGILGPPSPTKLEKNQKNDFY